MWLFAMTVYVFVIHRYLIPLFPLGFLLFFAYLWTPLNSYISARTFGILNRDLFEIPYLRQATFILSRYEEIDIWFAPLPLEDYGRGTIAGGYLNLPGQRLPVLSRLRL
jgi:hypothetical protein